LLTQSADCVRRKERKGKHFLPEGFVLLSELCGSAREAFVLLSELCGFAREAFVLLSELCGFA
jgi:hypothetical protein